MAAKAKQATTPEYNPNSLQEYSSYFKILVLLLQGFCYYVLILTRKDAHTGTRKGNSNFQG
jgi:hypothetical protein